MDELHAYVAVASIRFARAFASGKVVVIFGMGQGETHNGKAGRVARRRAHIAFPACANVKEYP
jgi:hypothetical protein